MEGPGAVAVVAFALSGEAAGLFADSPVEFWGLEQPARESNIKKVIGMEIDRGIFVL
ncbi:MAG: hypothetical protein ACREBG_02670 [Pyrinomonadaceae bacterium]